MTQDKVFEPDMLKKAVLNDAEAREFKKNATPICYQDKAEGMQLKGFLHTDGRILLTKAGSIPRKRSAQLDTLHLMLHGKWFNAILHGSKRVEYRQINPRWTKQIWKRRDTLKTLVLHRGYTANVILVAISKIDIGPCPYPGWDGEYYRVHFTLPGDIG